MEQFAETDARPDRALGDGPLPRHPRPRADPALVLEVGTAIGYSTLHMAEGWGAARSSPSSATRPDATGDRLP